MAQLPPELPAFLHPGPASPALLAFLHLRPAGPVLLLAALASGWPPVSGLRALHLPGLFGFAR
ncbi:hypothetical protein [Poseidonocella sp. HB161398]|uniref:hypothetical protein n=1 Tax=Poseidonocella sp. HB161398 TaxID=2320855 RepID=UPI001108F8D3|nr:hypothetical protein [Poseidonocella sp. HB161398]